MKARDEPAEKRRPVPSNGAPADGRATVVHANGRRTPTAAEHLEAAEVEAVGVSRRAQERHVIVRSVVGEGNYCGRVVHGHPPL